MKLNQTGIPKIDEAHCGVQSEFKVITRISPPRPDPPAADTGKFPFISAEIF